MQAQVEPFSNSIIERCIRARESFSDKIAVTQIIAPKQAVHLTYAELHSAATGLSKQLLELGIGPGKCVGILMHRSREHVIAMLAVMETGAVFFPINERASIYQIDYIAKTSRCAVLLLDNTALFRLGELSTTQLAETQLVHFSIGEPVRSAQWCLDSLLARRRVHLVRSSDLSEEFLKRVPFTESLPAFALFTSGSTGTPKGVLISNSDFSNRVSGEIRAYGIESADCLLNVLPFSFDVGFNQLFTSLVSGATLVILNSWMGKDICYAARNFGATGLSATPGIWRAVLRLSIQDIQEMFSRLRYVTVSGGDLAQDELKRLFKASGNTTIFKTYGQTETFRSSMLRLTADTVDKIASVGRALDGVSLMIIRADGSKADVDEVGEIVHQGEGRMIGYLGDPKMTSEKIRPLALPGADANAEYVFTGDLGKIDADGYLYVLGRMDQMIKIRDLRIYPLEVAEQLKHHPDVEEAVAFGRPFADGDTQIIVVVKVVSGLATTPEDLKAFAVRHLPSYMQPAKIEIVAEFPRTTSGKVDFSRLKESMA